MKSLRLWLLLLLAVLLPVRGAHAVAMHCASTGAAVQIEARLVEHGNHDHASADHHGQQHHDAAAHGHSGGGSHDHAGLADKCNLCSASCSAPALVSGPVTVAEPQPVSAVFPHLYAPPPSFIPDGQERPPRSI